MWRAKSVPETAPRSFAPMGPWSCPKCLGMIASRTVPELALCTHAPERKNQKKKEKRKHAPNVMHSKSVNESSWLAAAPVTQYTYLDGRAVLVKTLNNAGDSAEVALAMWSVLMWGTKKDRHRKAPWTTTGLGSARHFKRLSNKVGHLVGQSWLPITAMARLCWATRTQHTAHHVLTQGGHPHSHKHTPPPPPPPHNATRTACVLILADGSARPAGSSARIWALSDSEMAAPSQYGFTTNCLKTVAMYWWAQSGTHMSHRHTPRSIPSS